MKRDLTEEEISEMINILPYLVSGFIVYQFITYMCRDVADEIREINKALGREQ